MKVTAINGSLRKDVNSVKMPHQWADGFKYIYPDAVDPGLQVRTIIGNNLPLPKTKKK